MAKLLKALMSYNEITTWDIASALNKSQSHASQIVCGRIVPSQEEALVIADIVKCEDPSVLFPVISGQSTHHEKQKKTVKQ